MELDFKAMQEAEKKHAEESKQAFNDFMQGIREKHEKEQSKFN